ncbi:nuclear transcription factor Y subunit gamma-like [Lineus longissimus]|uniref:nuclear transcription factor Y subunit gamma-like n=1 Tax=Lineus longissimus TaxID=88925 RepID=UPI002B4ED59B
MVTEEIRKLQTGDFKTQELPLARIKKIMKLDEDVKMISAEAPVLFAKAAEIFISELSLRAWVHTEDNKRRTLQRNDIAMAITKYDQFDFLIDIVPRDELKPPKRAEEAPRAAMLPEQVQYYFQLAQQHQAAQQQQTTATTATTQQPTQQAIQVQGQPNFQVPIQVAGQVPQAITLANPAGGDAQQQQPQVIQIQAPQQQVSQAQTTQVTQPTQTVAQQQASAPVFQQVVSSTGEVQNIPIQLTPSQLQAIQLHMQGKGTNQPIILQAGNQQQTVSVAQQQQTEQALQQFQQQQPVYQIQMPTTMSQQTGQQIYIQQVGEEEQSGVEQEAPQ